MFSVIKWVSTINDLPEEWKRVLLIHKTSVEIGYLFSDGYGKTKCLYWSISALGKDTYFQDVSHWAELPQLGDDNEQQLD